MDLTLAIIMIVIAAVVVLAATLNDRSLRRKITKRDALFAGIRTRLEDDHGILVGNAHIEAALAGPADGSVNLAEFSDGSLREVLLRRHGQDLAAYYGNGEQWDRLPQQSKAEIQ